MRIRVRAIVYYNGGTKWFVRFNAQIISQDDLPQRIEAWGQRNNKSIKIDSRLVEVETKEDALMLYLTFS